MKNLSCCVILLAAGKSKRFSKTRKVKKQFFKIKNKTLLEYCLDTFCDINFIKQIIIAVDNNDINKAKKIIKKYLNKKKIVITAGGEQRYDSVHNAVKLVDGNINYVLIHDVARPLVSKKLILKCLYKIKNYDGIIPAITPVDTVKIVNKNFESKYTLPRNEIVLAQTPQVFKTNVVKHIYSEKVLKKWTNKLLITDDAQLAELEGKKIKVIPGEIQNIKVTTKQDIKLLEFFLNNKL